nr:zinc ribbon domain-containing protein [Lachnospiraceae bacterium]
MGRHGGGSRSGGSRSSSSSSSRGGGSGARTSKTPFHGCYNRSYYDRHGKYHHYYTSNKNFGTKSGWSIGVIFVLIFVTLHMLLMLSAFSSTLITFGKKVNGDRDRIYIVDHAEALSAAEEEKVLDLLNEVYEKSGMPVTVYTDNFDWRKHYMSIEVYSEELYYGIGYDEDAMILLYTTDNSDDFYDYEYDFYCGADTIACLSDKTFDKLIDNFYKGMSGLKLYDALDYSFRSVMDELAETHIDWSMFPVTVILLLFYSIFYISILGSTMKSNSAYKYFKEHPEELSSTPMTLYSTCPNCGAPNTAQGEICPYCNGLLKVTDKNVTFIQPK